MKLRTAFNLIALSLVAPLLAGFPTKEQLETFYPEYLHHTEQAGIPGTNPSKNKTPLGRFTDQNFMLWDYLTAVADGKETLSEHFDNLKTFCVNRKIQRVIIFIDNPASFSFFQPDNTSDDSFIAKANALYQAMTPVVPNFEIAVFFEDGQFSSNAPTGNYPNNVSRPTGTFDHLNNMLDWVNAIAPQIEGLKEFAFDPDGVNKATAQPIYNYSDAYKWLNPISYLRVGTTLGISESKEAYANVARFPVNSLYTNGLGVPFTNSDGKPHWERGSDPDAPLLQSVYIQAYQSTIPAMFATHNGNTAAVYFNSMLRDVPYLTGKGTISFERHQETVTGNGTEFNNLKGLPLIYAPDSNAPFYGKPNKLGEVSGITSDTSMTLYTSAFSSNSAFVPYTHTEIVTDWKTTSPQLTQEMVDSIIWMFSLNYQPSQGYTFFGNWSLSNFMDFIDAVTFHNNHVNTAPFLLNGSGPMLNFPSTNYAIYQYDFAVYLTSDWDLLNGQ